MNSADRQAAAFFRPALYCISDPSNGDPVALLQAVERCAVNFFQFRHKALAPSERVRVGTLLGSVERRTTRLLVSQSPELARTIGADGVHFPAADFPERKIAREAAGNIVGVSVHSLDEALQAARWQVDYLLLAPVFAPLSKPSGRSPLGLEALRQICSAVTVPVIALGGMRAEHFASVLDAGADGIAGISLFATEDRIEATVEDFRRAVGRVDGGERNA